MTFITLSETLVCPRSSPYRVASVSGTNVPASKSARSFESRKIDLGTTTALTPRTNGPYADVTSNVDCPEPKNSRYTTSTLRITIRERERD